MEKALVGRSLWDMVDGELRKSVRIYDRAAWNVAWLLLLSRTLWEAWEDGRLKDDAWGKRACRYVSFYEYAQEVSDGRLKSAGVVNNYCRAGRWAAAQLVLDGEDTAVLNALPLGAREVVAELFESVGGLLPARVELRKLEDGLVRPVVSRNGKPRVVRVAITGRPISHVWLMARLLEDPDRREEALGLLMNPKVSWRELWEYGRQLKAAREEGLRLLSVGPTIVAERDGRRVEVGEIYLNLDDPLNVEGVRELLRRLRLPIWPELEG